MTQPPPAPSSRQPGVPPALDGLVQRLLARSPDERPGDAYAVARELAPLVQA